MNGLLCFTHRSKLRSGTMADTVTVAPYGKWDSPISAEHLSGGGIHFEGLQINVSVKSPMIICDMANKKSSRPDKSSPLNPDLQKVDGMPLWI